MITLKAQVNLQGKVFAKKKGKAEDPIQGHALVQAQGQSDNLFEVYLKEF